MKVFITGGTGFIGSHLIEYLISKEAEIYALVRNPSNLRWLTPIKDKIHILKGDLFNFPEIPRDIDFIFHLAGITKSSSTRIKNYYLINHIGTANLLNFLESTKIFPKKFIYLSSLSVTGPSRPESPNKEDDPPNPISHYGRSKLLGEKEVLSRKNKFQSVIIRTPGIYGPRDKDFLSGLKSVKKGFFISFGKKVWLSLCYVKDLVEGMFLASQTTMKSGEIFNIADSKIYTWEEFCLTAAEIMNVKVKKIIIPVSLVYPICFISEIFSILSKQDLILNFDRIKELKQESWVCMSEKAKKYLKFKARYSLKEGLKETISWYREQKWL
ncbi:NAD(P)-dependent oxidoreductase [Candidatus Aminicenantes bacterium AC-335-B20]|jgi:nucleoside-diphosphate-sugar epimerase|nr:NAD(P)-dependent oxidoreductase [SCandidatus Aminicenantes bacterium Aminicenantia_JdfR_composite]MCP2597369.1 NAD(P)-dependent oxidoreductase [Candidatus Aminicenantes bacterium AC-335-G13]MCP2599036.1 NAD(P)-dependent oxidoreductase [Candidatus Aminicenantes bacterium AC-335-B20]MCP2605849.1 NAD(P)-dependent oxidoreductase [Candidatus Aminicenantes bacterium AC-335-O07]MCP2619060.1 NAD(P)-dependent oxidoreductase [Candidatus Aminicenantes bacterium AC-335-A11]MCP2619592.1 NAD(P)-dependent